MILDLFLVLIAAFGFYMGYSRGVIKTVFTVVGVLLGILITLKLSPLVIGFLEGLFNRQNPWIFILGFAGTFILVLALVRFTGKNLENLFKAVKLNFVNKIAGGALLSLLFMVCFSYVVWFLDRTHLVSDSTKNRSVTYPVLAVMPEQTRLVAEKLKPVFREFWDKTVQIIDGIKESSEQKQESN
ncbi:MAG TPA: CvpA family protein [Saprospiraceae bacterium]|nr:CvpA family protein [Saprospiraceae bacterium]MCB9272309.1 CvpA family protein [Lewinellaceae bacterium]HPG08083.1 CvpA family protein [Saprospiraceae bacterium]HPR00185.1 CvpA family protein [Saprospiraceae bacterium]HRV85995.1 CvpA family protein [Saprospiraceae bacterium]